MLARGGDIGGHLYDTQSLEGWESATIVYSELRLYSTAVTQIINHVITPSSFLCRIPNPA